MPCILFVQAVVNISVDWVVWSICIYFPMDQKAQDQNDSSGGDFYLSGCHYVTVSSQGKDGV